MTHLRHQESRVWWIGFGSSPNGADCWPSAGQKTADGKDSWGVPSRFGGEYPLRQGPDWADNILERPELTS